MAAIDHPLKRLLSTGNFSFRQTVADLMLIVANKPIAYSSLRTFTTYELWNHAKRFVRTRQPEVSELDIAQCISEIEQAFSAANIDIITFAQPGAPLSSSTYYESEAQIQDIVLRTFFSEIDASVKGLARSPTESRLFKVWIEELLANQEKATITLDMSRINHRFQKEYEKEAPKSLDAALVVETLARARLAYPIDSNTVWPFWYTKSPSWLQGYMLALKERS